MTPSDVGASENRQVEVSEISRGLKILARELDCPVMALSQLNRQLEYRQDKRPMLADLRESRVARAGRRRRVFIYRDEIYNPESDQRGTAEIIVAKHRNGPTGVARLAFLDRQIRFENMAARLMPQAAGAGAGLRPGGRARTRHRGRAPRARPLAGRATRDRAPRAASSQRLEFELAARCCAHRRRTVSSAPSRRRSARAASSSSRNRPECEHLEQLLFEVDRLIRGFRIEYAAMPVPTPAARVTSSAVDGDAASGAGYGGPEGRSHSSLTHVS